MDFRVKSTLRKSCEKNDNDLGKRRRVLNRRMYGCLHWLHSGIHKLEFTLPCGVSL